MTKEPDGAALGLTERDMPGLFTAADIASVKGQRSYVNAVRLRLLLAVFAAATGVISWRVGGGEADLAAVGTTIALAATVVVELYLRSSKPEEVWYDGRALAESAKSLAWRFSVCGMPFARQGGHSDPEMRFIQQVHKLLKEAPTTSVEPTNRPVITNRMRTLRCADLATRKSVYLAERIANQQAWYGQKANANEVLAHRWRVSLLVIEVVGISAALVKALGYITLDVAGLFAALIAASAAWIGLRQHALLARAYTFASHELLIAASRLELIEDEDVWAKEVADSEEAISREHTMWRASRSRASD